MNTNTNEQITLDCQLRKELGTKSSNELRIQDKIPAVIYGGDKNEIMHIAIDAKIFNVLFTKKQLISKIFLIKFENGETQKVVIKDFQIDHLSRKVLHIDFIRVCKDNLIKVKVPIFYINKSKSIAIKKGALLNIAKYYVNIKCKGDNIPEKFEIDLDGTDVTKRFYIEDLVLPKDAQIIKPGQILCNFASKRGKAIKA